MSTRVLGALIGALLCSAVLAPAAPAATLVVADGVLTYSAAAGKINVVGFDEVTFDGATSLARVDVYRDPAAGDDDPITATGCTPTPMSSTTHYVCSSVARVVAVAGDLDDALDAGGGQAGPSTFGGASPLLAHIPADFDLGDGDDFGNGGNFDDSLSGGAGADVLHLDQTGGGPNAGDDVGQGGAGADVITGARGDDAIGGGDDDDLLIGEWGTDAVAGGEGDDRLVEGPGGDDLRGDSGFDLVEYPAPLDGESDPVSVTLDDVRNDGRVGDAADNVHTDVEDVHVLDTGAGAATVTGSAAVNSIMTADGADTVDPGANNDVVSTGDGDDTVNARDGYADRITCGPGADTANIDDFDVVGDSCETVNAVASAYVTEDRSPTVSWVEPEAGTQMSTISGNRLTVTVSDDTGISQVLILDDQRVVCTLVAPPYSCDYKPQGDDVGRNTLVAVVIDVSQQTASAIRSVIVPRFVSPRLSADTRPRVDRKGPRTFTTTGRLTLPTGVTQGQGCTGKVAVTFKAGKKTISTRRVDLRRDCVYRSKVTFRIPSRLAGKLQVVTRFAGNAVVAPRNAKRGRVTT